MKEPFANFKAPLTNQQACDIARQIVIGEFKTRNSANPNVDHRCLAYSEREVFTLHLATWLFHASNRLDYPWFAKWDFSEEPPVRGSNMFEILAAKLDP